MHKSILTVLLLTLFVANATYGANVILDDNIPTCCFTNIPGPNDKVTGCYRISQIYNCMGSEYIDCNTCESGYNPKTTLVTPCGNTSMQLTITTCQLALVDCPAGQYKEILSCINCPSPGTSIEGSVGITSCFTNEEIKIFSDAYGSGYTKREKCYYSE